MKLEDFKDELKESPFKTVFKATCAFYIAQAMVTLTGLALVFVVITIGYMIIK